MIQTERFHIDFTFNSRYLENIYKLFADIFNIYYMENYFFLNPLFFSNMEIVEEMNSFLHSDFQFRSDRLIHSRRLLRLQ